MEYLFSTPFYYALSFGFFELLEFMSNNITK